MGEIKTEDQNKKEMEELKKSEDLLKKIFIGLPEGFALCEILLDENEKPVDYRFILLCCITKLLTKY